MKPRVLVICGDVWHPAETIQRGLASLCASDYDVEFFESGANRLAEILPDVSTVLLAKANMISQTDERPWLTVELTAAIQSHLDRGNGLVVIHAGTARYEQSPAMVEMMGGTFMSHPDQCPVTIEPKAGHPLVNGVARFTVRDEHYFMTMKHSQPLDVFLHSRSLHGLQPAGWTRTAAGGGRICVLTPGHNLEVWLHPEFQKLLLNALRWTAKLN
jgi:type 1 glutamine amidotransferase